MNVTEETARILAELGVRREQFEGGGLETRTPITGEVIGRLPLTSNEETRQLIARAHEAFLQWRTIPAPRRGELVRLLGEELRGAKALLGRLVTIEAGKIVSEGLGEVQEMIDICTYAAGLSRQLCGLTIATERPH
ncbi:MAG: aldehyde dehydrogenase family protein, partial [Acidobacteriota bacterium]|nr:aldehyde dehydrogenase family protein [Acidobacteriota bacterium]